MSLSRRKFLSQTGLLIGTSAALSSTILIKDLYGWVKNRIQSDYKQELIKSSPVARHWISTETKNVNCASCHSLSQISGKNQFDHEETIIKCLLCAQGCIIKENERGKCRARMNINGQLKSLVYGRPISINIDPIEKKPFYHFLPGKTAYSLATAGCPLSCQFCQNWEISQAKPEDFQVEFTPPEEIASNTQSENVPIIAFTYNEPTVFDEYLIDIAKQAKKKNIRNVLVSCGFMNEEPLKEMCEVLDGIKIDLKGFSEEFYRKVSGAELKPVLRSIKQISKTKVHLEIVNLVVPTLNDSEKMLNDFNDWIFNEVGPDVPVHFTRFHPDYKLLNLPPTPVSTLERARDIALSKGIHYAYIGNVPGHAGNLTYCPKCGKILIKRTGFFTTEIHLKNSRCEYCKNFIAGVWD
ncbi:MAG TPA: AmmeMemoRadiSam system radical SAM enzyme [Ignavibacteriaceae bacterium]|nr:AmmeMemoRadiSam system radical SAM enzyme [Ignavibacteriaceae bacterium]